MRLPVATTALAALALTVPLLGAPSASAAPAAVPHPAAPVGGCAITQDVDATTVAISGMTLTKPRVKVQERNAYRVGKKWRAYTHATVTWSTTGSATTTQNYASADCGVAPRTVTATARRTGTVSFTISARPYGATRKAALKESRARVVKRSKRYALPQAKALLTEKALLKGRLAFIDTLPTRPVPIADRPTRKLTGKQACPVTLAPGKRKDWERASQAATVVPQFDTPAALWVCTYPMDADLGPVVRRTKVTGAQKARIMAGLRGITTPSPTEAQICTTSLSGQTMISLVSPSGDVTGVVVDNYGCNNVAMTSDPRREAAGARDSAGVPQGTFVSTRTLLHALGV